MTTRADIEAQIADDLARSDLTSQIGTAINTAIRAYRFERMGFNEAYRVTATLTVSMDSKAFTDVSVRFRKIDRMRIVRSTNDYLDLYRRDYDWVMSRQDVRTVAVPSEYAVYNSTFHFDSLADQTYTILIDGLKDLGNAASGTYTAGDASAWFNDARELIRHRAKRELYANVLKDMELAGVAKAAETDALDTLKAEAGEQNTTGFIRPSEF